MKKNINKGLGRGLDALLASSNTDEDKNLVLDISVNMVDPGREQPRKQFDNEKLETLAESIKVHGVVQPIIVRKNGERYDLVAGERRWRASRLAGLKTIPAIVKDYSTRDVMEIALIENLQREDLNPIEEAEAFVRLIGEYGLTQEEVSKLVGRSRSAVANSVRILTLPKSIQDCLVDGSLTAGHARTLVGIDDKARQDSYVQQIIAKQLNVRQTEALINRCEKRSSKMQLEKNISQGQSRLNSANQPFGATHADGESVGYPSDLNIDDPLELDSGGLINDNKSKLHKAESNAAALQDLQDRLRDRLGTQVEIAGSAVRGKIQISYFSTEDLNRLAELIIPDE